MIRSFLAIELPEPILRKIEEVQGDLRSTHADVRWVSPEKIHFTLKFFGNIEESRIDPIFKSIEEPIRNTLPFSLKVRGIGGLPPFEKPKGDLDGIGKWEGSLHFASETNRDSIRKNWISA